MCINPIKIINKQTNEEITVPCGKCIICRRKKCREWALKLYHEGQYYKKMCMVTLTFRPNFLLKPKIKELVKYKTKTDKETGEKKKEKIKYKTIISPKYITDVKLTGWLVTLFIKKLRKHFENTNINFAYFAVGEHGSQNTHRAHWHILFFGIDKETLESVNIGKSKKNKEIYFSKIIDEKWSYDKVKIGQHTISDVTTSTIKYVANYTMKKMYNNGNKYPVTMRFSNQNKIGKKWARKYHKELRKGVLEDNDGNKYSVPKSYYNEMLRYYGDIDNKSMEQTAREIEYKKEELIEKLKKKGLLTEEEIMKKAKKMEYRYKNSERDTI